ncbi:MAG: LysR family transcriptional regulator, partial [Oscillospiraceae bacterium]|nr:LysR family transcriptional regulator [Oscillospiraceae bacterium]
MQLRDLEYVVAIAQTGSFSKAAAQMFVSQPALSQAVARLEEEFGLQIFHRTRGVITPTEAGRVLLEDGLSVLQMSIRIQKRMSDVQNLRTGQVSIGISHLYGKYYFS